MNHNNRLPCVICNTMVDLYKAWLGEGGIYCAGCGIIGRMLALYVKEHGVLRDYSANIAQVKHYIDNILSLK